MDVERNSLGNKPLEVGDRVNWLRSSRGGYGFVTPAAAVVLKIGANRVQVRVARCDAGTWQAETRWVEVDNLKPRSIHVPEVDEVDL